MNFQELRCCSWSEWTDWAHGCEIDGWMACRILYDPLWISWIYVKALTKRDLEASKTSCGNYKERTILKPSRGNCYANLCYWYHPSSDTIEVQDAVTPSERIRLRDEQHEVTVLRVYNVSSNRIQPRNSLMFSLLEANLRARLQRTIRASRERVQAMQRQDPPTFANACSIRPIVVRFWDEPEGEYNVRSSR